MALGTTAGGYRLCVDEGQIAASMANDAPPKRGPEEPMNITWIGALALTPILVSAAHGATVTGAVKGPDGAPFRGAFIQAQHAGTKVTTSVLSDRQGRYRF